MMVSLMSTGTPPLTLVLASSSTTRAKMLSEAGLIFEIEKPEVDEADVRLHMIAASATVESGAERLAALKASDVSQRRTNTLVIGADQILECDGKWFEKPGTTAQARDQLRDLSGRRHRLISSVVLAVDGIAVWRHTAEAQLTMRPLGERFLEDYLNAMGDRAFTSVGGYQLEGLGAQLFSRIRGDYFTILGLPLLPLLAQLRSRDVLGN